MLKLRLPLLLLRVQLLLLLLRMRWLTYRQSLCLESVPERVRCRSLAGDHALLRGENIKVSSENSVRARRLMLT